MSDTTIPPLTDAEVASGFGITPALTTAPSISPIAPIESRDLVQMPGLGEVDLVTATTPAAPQLTQAADGSYHLVLTWTKSTKAHVGTAVAALVGLGELATTYVLPAGSPYTAWAQTALGVVGLAGVWLGVYLPTNKGKKNP